MTPTLTELGLDRLSAEERREVAEKLWESVAAELESLPLSAELRTELERRLALADADPGCGVPWETIRVKR